MFWLILIFIISIVIYIGVGRIASSAEQEKKSNRTALDREIQQQLKNAGLEVTDELVHSVKGHYQSYQRAFAYFEGDGVPQSYEQARILWSDVAEIYPLANVLLGTMAFEGLGGQEKNVQLAMQYYYKALELDHECKEAMFQLAGLYHLGEGVAQDDSQAYQWYQKAADLGDVEAENKLAWLYYEGKGVEKNKIKAFIKWAALAKQGHIDAQHCLGVPCYFLGHGTVQNSEQAFYWTQLAAQSGSLEASANLGLWGRYAN